MWMERFLIIVPTLAHPRLSFNWGSYKPTWVEVVLLVGTFGYFVLLYAVFTKLFPIVAVWEYKEGRGPAPPGATQHKLKLPKTATATGD
jgi:molybdopterin-containing oxidoreductase family membrane subunit